ncbi:MAG: HAMP domain-containing histidine kinase [Planctomycetota bacterium]|nr:HAMP domain-containing histidine kinase [Planctomycetota bacterium]
MSDLPQDPRNVTISLADLQRLTQQLAHVSGASLPPRLPNSSVENLEILNTLIDQCAKQLARQRARVEARRMVEEELRKLERMKTEFIQNVSHELRTPLASIEGFAMALLRGMQRKPGEPENMPPETRRRFLEIISQESRRLGELIEAVLDITEIEANPLNVNQNQFQVREVFLEAVMNLKMKYGEDKAAAVRFDLLPEPEGPAVYANREALREILRHLLDNAHKFSGGQEIVLGAAPAAPEAPGGPPLTRIWVCDRGIGISKADQARLFTKFFRAETSAHTIPGTGLGLSIAQTLARQNAGRISVLSEVGRGATFTVLMPGKAPVAAASGVARPA